MNTNASASSSSAASRTTTRDGTRCTDPHTLRREGDRFERLLRDKSASRDEDSDDAVPVAPPDCAAQTPLSALGNPLQGPAAAAAAVARAGAAASDTATQTQAALGTAMAAQQPLQQHAGNADLNTFQVSINEPMGLPLELRAVRVPDAGNVAAPALWALNIATPSRDAAALARQGSRLDERLRARGIDPASLRVDDRGDDREDKR